MLHNLMSIERACPVDWGGPVCIDAVHMSSFLQQKLYNLQVTGHTRCMKWGAPVVTVAVHVGTYDGRGGGG